MLMPDSAHIGLSEALELIGMRWVLPVRTVALRRTSECHEGGREDQGPGCGRVRARERCVPALEIVDRRGPFDEHRFAGGPGGWAHSGRGVDDAVAAGEADDLQSGGP